jgi:Ran GTPase-activating protein (RanGAP) involved in mRNA processing and transport
MAFTVFTEDPSTRDVGDLIIVGDRFSNVDVLGPLNHSVVDEVEKVDKEDGDKEDGDKEDGDEDDDDEEEDDEADAEAEDDDTESERS